MSPSSYVPSLLSLSFLALLLSPTLRQKIRAQAYTPLCFFYLAAMLGIITIYPTYEAFCTYLTIPEPTGAALRLSLVLLQGILITVSFFKLSKELKKQPKASL